MKTKIFLTKTLLLVSLLLGGTSHVWATDIPLSVGTYLTTSEATTTGYINNNDGGNLGSIKKTDTPTTATFSSLTVSETQNLVLTFLTGNNNNSSPKVTVTLNNGTSDIFTTGEVAIEKTAGSWTPSTKHIFDLGAVPAGTYSLKFTFDNSNTNDYVCNLGSIGIYNKTTFDATIDAIPGGITLTKGVYKGPKTENDGANVGYVQNNGTAAYTFYSSMEGAYDMALDIYRYNQGGTMNVKIVDLATGAEDYNQDYTIASDAPGSYTENSISIPNITKGYKTMTFTFSNGNSYICNYKNINFAFKGTAAEFTAYTITGQTIDAGTDTDYLCNLPVNYDATTTFAIGATNGTIVVSAKDADNNDVSVTDNHDGTYTIPTPGLNTYTIATATLTANPGAVASKTTCTLKIFRIGEVSLTDIKVDGTSIDVLTDINNAPYAATYGACYTTAPVVTATQIDNNAATISTPAISGNTYTYTIHAAIAGTDIQRDYTLVLNNVHVYTATGDEEAVNIKNNEGTRDNDSWTNGIYTLSTTSLDGYNQYFKMNGNDYTISLPSDVVVKQLIFKECSNNYAGNNARLLSVTSTGATAYIPVDNKFYHESEGAKHDIIVNIEGHTAGTDIQFNMPKSGQPMTWIQLTTVKSNPGTAPQKIDETINVVNNHAVVTLTFDREIPNDVNATINNTTVTAEGGSAVLVFPIWGLDYSTNYTMTIAAGAVKDSYDNTNTEAISVAVNTEAKPAVAAAVYDYVVSNADELDAAIAALKVSNKTADAARKTVFLKNGNYSYGTLTGTYQYNVSLKIDNWNDIYNVSLIGESKDGVLIEGTTDGITSSTLNLGNGTGIYLQDMTIRNNYDYPAADKGVSVAVTGGNKAILKNVAMQACQDTYVTGKRTYLEGCDIYGTVDFICGGGDIFFKENNLILVYRPEGKGDVIVAPNTTADTKWGYVFQGCTIKAREGETMLAEKNYSLGRPWQNEPRTYYLNTTMEILPSDNGWSGMSNINTHFYEYNSLDKDGNALDLSDRLNSPSSTNHYTPVLTVEEAQKFTVENVLGGTDSWLPTDYTIEVAAPTVSLSDGNLSWTTVDDARCYVVFKNGEYLTHVTGTSYAIDEEGVYAVRAANEMGGLGAASTGVVFKRNISANKWSTIVLPFDIAASDIETVFGADAIVAELTDGTDTQINFTTTLTDNKMKANQPYAIKVASAFTAAAISIQPSTLQPSKETPTQHVANWDFVGTYTNGIIPQDSYFFNSNKLWQATDDTNTIAPFRAYFTFTGGAAARDINFVIDGETTGINRPSSQPHSTTEGSSYYTLDGRKLSGKPTQKGVYIVNGKKLLKK